MARHDGPAQLGNGDRVPESEIPNVLRKQFDLANGVRVGIAWIGFQLFDGHEIVGAAPYLDAVCQSFCFGRCRFTHTHGQCVK